MVHNLIVDNVHLRVEMDDFDIDKPNTTRNQIKVIEERSGKHTPFGSVKCPYKHG